MESGSLARQKLRTRSSKELDEQFEGLLVLAEVLNSRLSGWFLSGGTLLGAHRDGDFIPWDWDVEVTVLTEEVKPREGQLLMSLAKAGFLITGSDSSVGNFKIVATGWGTDYEILGRSLDTESRLRKRDMTEVPAAFFESRDSIKLRGKSFPAPAPVEGFLEALYGDWRTPRKTLDKQAYFSNAAYRKMRQSRLRRLIPGLMRTLFPPRVKEFPKISEEALMRFRSWDSDLGWCNQPNVIKIDKSDRSASEKKKAPDGFAIFSTDERGSRTCKYPEGTSDISVYGDSYGMCRDVHDWETFAWWLAAARRTRVSNYGVGNFGLDQGLLHLERNFANDPAETVIMAVPTITMARCVSVYRHYLEPGNLLAVQPRFLLNADGELSVLPYPLEKKTDFRRLDQFQQHFRQHDQHFEFWRENRRRYFTSTLPRKVLARYGVGSTLPEQKTFDYEASFWTSEEKLFMGMMQFYKELSQKLSFRPIFLLQHQKRSLEFVQKRPAEELPWRPVIDRAVMAFPEITFLDESIIFADYESVEDLYTRSHHSPTANRMIASYLNEQL